MGGKTVEIDVEVIDGNLDYKILLGRPWIYAMAAVVSTYFRNIAFPFQGGITIVDQQTFLPNSLQVMGSIPMIHGSSQLLKNIGVGLLKDPTLMGTFALIPPNNLAEVAKVHPKKATAIKAEVEKLLHAGFIYLVPLTDWVSNIVPVMKNQGTIRVCVDYRDVNQACPKDNYPTPFIDQIIDECTRCEIFSFMNGFSRYNQINICTQDQSKKAFICLWGTFAYYKLPFGLKNVGAMNYAFHDIKNIVQPYLDDLLAHLRKRTDHPRHLREIFLCCRHYKIRLNPHKCVFCVSSVHLLGFVVSKHRIRLNPCKVQGIIDLPPPSNLLQIQKLQGKANFLRRFIPNYTELAKGYMRLLKNKCP
eukprot:PITA_34586